MKTLRQSGLAFIPVVVLLSLIPSVRAQSNPDQLQELKATATMTEALDWLAKAISAYAAISVNNERTGISSFKGFKLVEADGCTLMLKNEGKLKTGVAYMFEATIPIANLNSSSSKVYQHVTDYPAINEAYGTWAVRFSVKNKERPARMYAKDSPEGDLKGHLVTFTFQKKEEAEIFEKGLKQVIKICGGK